MQLHWLQRLSSVLTLSLLFVLRSVSFSAEDTPLLTVGQSGAYLYPRQDADSGAIAKLEKGERVTPLAQAVGPQTWYMVKTQQGLIGWVRGEDIVGAPLKETFKERSVSAWSARTSDGRVFEGTWTVAPASSATAVSGTWTLSDWTDKIKLRGTWSAEKFSTGWQGVWRAVAEGQSSVYGGTWTADFSGARDARLVELFAAAAKDAIRGVWKAGDHSGSWTIRAPN